MNEYLVRFAAAWPPLAAVLLLRASASFWAALSCSVRAVFSCSSAALSFSSVPFSFARAILSFSSLASLALSFPKASLSPSNVFTAFRSLHATSSCQSCITYSEQIMSRRIRTMHTQSSECLAAFLQWAHTVIADAEVAGRNTIAGRRV